GGERFGTRLYRRGGIRGTLGDHDFRRFDGDHVTIVWLVRAGAGTDVDHACCIAERRPDGSGEAMVGPADTAVAVAHQVVAGGCHEESPGLSSPSTPATAWAARSSSCGACPASAITAPSAISVETGSGCWSTSPPTSHL